MSVTMVWKPVSKLLLAGEIRHRALRALGLFAVIVPFSAALAIVPERRHRGIDSRVDTFEVGVRDAHEVGATHALPGWHGREQARVGAFLRRSDDLRAAGAAAGTGARTPHDHLFGLGDLARRAP